MALVLAIILWAIVSLKDQAEDLITARLVPIPAQGMELAGAPPRVRVLVRGLGRELLKLHQSPPVIRWRLPLTTSDEVTLELLPTHVSLPPDVEADVEEVMPRFVTVRVRRGDRPPVAHIAPPAEARAAEPRPAPITASGPADTISPLLGAGPPLPGDSTQPDTIVARVIVPAPPRSQP